MNDTIPATGHLLGAADIRRIAADAGISPTKKFGQNFVIDPGTVRRIVREAGVTAADHVMEVGPVTPENVPDFSDDASFTLVANLPYNVATPILLTLLERFDNLGSFLVMVQKEVADRLAAKPGSKIYGTPSVKLAWYGTAERVGTIGPMCSGRLPMWIPRSSDSPGIRPMTRPPREPRTAQTTAHNGTSYFV